MERLTEDELVAWEERHDSIAAWEGTWRKLTIIIALIGLYLTLFTDHLVLGCAFSFGSWIFVAAMAVCWRRHYRMHEERGDFDQ